jgi:glycosyltransferase 2 family protein
VFDATILIGLGGGVREPLLAALLMFRFLYHLVPLSIALLLFGGVEAWRSLRKKAAAGGAVASHRRIELESDHAGDDQRQTNEANWISGLTIEQHSDEDTADRAYPGPHGIRRTEGQRS